MDVSSLDDIGLLAENVEVECKLAGGRDGKGQLPNDFWPTYSAFANSHGGIIILGLAEKDRRLELAGILNYDKVRSDIFNQLGNGQKVSSNLLTDDSVIDTQIDGKWILLVEVPAAGRREKPVYINGNPMTGSFYRLNEGDHICDGEMVKRMLAEQTDDSRDSRVLKDFSPADLSAESVNSYRLLMRDRSPTHPFLDVDGIDFLRKIGAYRRDRDKGYDGLTAAGLLMFGNAPNIIDEFPNYFLDYQERPQAKTEARWVDRITLDGTWSGNLFDFYRRVYRKLISELKVPFALHKGVRLDETPVHEALREALVNTLVHADYTDRTPILVVKRPDMFGFRNPGMMRISVAQAFKGGESDGRNRILQSMFLLVGAGERAGSGVPKISKGWSDQHWRPPALYQREAPSQQTLLELRMIDLLPPNVTQFLRKMFGVKFDILSNEQRVILATAASEQFITHSRMLPICDMHPADLTRCLQAMVQDGYLKQTGRSRGATYRIPGSALPSPDTVFGESLVVPDSGGRDSKGTDLTGKGTEFGRKGTDLLTKGTDQRARRWSGGEGREVDGLPFLLIDALDEINIELRDELDELSNRVRLSGKVSKESMKSVILELCSERFMTLKVLSSLLGRDEAYLRIKILNQMVKDTILRRAFPQSPNDPRQAYTSS